MPTSKNPRRASIDADPNQESADYISEDDMLALHEEYDELSELRTSSIRPNDIFSAAKSIAAWNKKWGITGSKKISHKPIESQVDSPTPHITTDSFIDFDNENSKKILANLKARKSQRSRLTLETIRKKKSELPDS